MKKFLSKLPVMITFLSLAVVGLVFYVVMLARPVSYGMTYVYSETITEKEATSDRAAGNYAMKFQIMSDERAFMTVVSDTDTGRTEMKTEIWIIRNGDKIAFLLSSMTEKEYKEGVDALKADKAAWNDFWENGASQTLIIEGVNSFKLTMPAFDDEEAKNFICNGAIVFASVMGVIELALIAFGTLSTIFFIKGRKSAPATEPAAA